RLQHFGQRHRIRREPLSLENRMRHSVLKFMPARQQRRPRGSARRAHMKIREPHTFVMQPIDIRRLENRVSIARKIAVSLIVRQNKNDIRPPPSDRITSECRQRLQCDDSQKPTTANYTSERNGAPHLMYCLSGTMIAD